jgi:ABC-2 type transport system ATP-binding protein
VVDAALRLQGVTYRYGERAALSDVSFSVAPGESVGYLGPNGAGKSTTLKLLAGLLRPSSGTVEVLGAPADGPARARLGALIETPGLPAYLHGADLLRYVADVRGIPAAAQPEAIQRAAGELGVSDRLNEPVGGLSTGLTRRMLIATALVGDPEVLILDEPTLGLDPAARHDLRRVLRSLHGAGRTLLLSTHLLDDVEAVCDRVLFLRDGRLVGDEPVSGAPAPPGTSPSRLVRFRFDEPVELGQFAALLAPGESAQLESDRAVAVKLLGDDRRQTELIARIVGARLPLLSAGPALDGLTQRYLEAVGREEDP